MVLTLTLSGDIFSQSDQTLFLVKKNRFKTQIIEQANHFSMKTKAAVRNWRSESKLVPSVVNNK